MAAVVQFDLIREATDTVIQIMRIGFCLRLLWNSWMPDVQRRQPSLRTFPGRKTHLFIEFTAQALWF